MSQTLEDLEIICQKPRWRDQGSLLARRFARPLALYVTWLVRSWPVSANLATGCTLCTGWGAAILLAMPGCFPLGVATLWLWYLLDHVDGQLARLHNTQSVTGIYFDFMMHHLVHPAVAFAIGYGIASQTQYLPWTLGGAAFAFGLSTLSISNDCRYKAYFSNASRGLAMPLVAAQARGASRSPAATGGPSNETRSKRGRLSAGLKVLHATMLRLCEIPNIIVSLSILGTVAVWNPGLGNAVIQGYVLGMAVVAPTLGLMRLGKQVWYRLPDHEYISELYSFKRE